MRVVVIGANGQLASDLIPALKKEGFSVTGLLHKDVQIEDFDSVQSVLPSLKPQIVINTAAYHNVDLTEDNPEPAFAVNATGTRNVALVARELNAVFVHVSTDYVFSKVKESPYIESDPVYPVNLYAVTKVAGELLIRYLWGRHFIVRSGGLYGLAGSSVKGHNFVDLMIQLARQGKTIRVVNDQKLTPTSTNALARQIVSLIQTSHYGTYHATCQGECTWYEFAAEIFRLCNLKPDFGPQTSKQSNRRAMRPAYSVLENANLKKIGLDVMPSWQEALEEYLKLKGEI